MSTSTPKARGNRSPLGAATPSGDTTLTGLQRLPGHTRYPLTPSRLVTVATPGTQRSASRYTPRARGGGAPATPYGLRARQQRAANTPGRDRRRSGRVQRETTFDILRNLGRALAPISEPIRSSPQEKPEPIPDPIDEFEQFDNEPDIERPRLSLPIQESEEEDEDASPEIHPRECLSHASFRDRDRLSMMSRATGRISGDFEDTRLESDGADDTGVIGDDYDAEDTMISGGDFDKGGETEDLGRFHFDLNFPSPAAAPLEDPVGGDIDDMEDFELSTADVDPLPAQSDDDDDDDAGGDFGFGLDLAPAASPSESPGIVGGGLRDEAIPTQGKQKKISRHGIPVPNLPAGVVKKLATRFARSGAGSRAKINKATLAAIEQASAWYFEQASQDLAAYSKHAGRKTIDESDVTTLLRRQRHINNSTTVFSLAQKHLPKELQQDMRLAMPP
ncbi:Histone-fold [Penicillium paradoxum]|uniref:Histone-fold n=1 Tax=Penicillium paradoxum TaxID=176176 RepID=UPI002546EADE|nr:Histone-fold [Penicillium paradoxum]KAJ5780975.1 Histone-fold [Penicillium paradoxum]